MNTVRVYVRRRALEEWAISRNLPLIKVAESAGIGKAHLSSLLAHKYAPGAKTRRQLQEATGLGFHDLFEMIHVETSASRA